MNTILVVFFLFNMIFPVARKQLNSFNQKDKQQLKSRVDVFAASENNIITHFHKGIMAIKSINQPSYDHISH